MIDTNNWSDSRWRWIILLVTSLLFLPFLGNVHLFDWDEINFAEAAREMIVTGEYYRVQINYLTFWEKPPLFIWMQALSMLVFGVGEYAARFPNAICGIITCLAFFEIGRREVDRSFALTWVGLYICSLLPHFYFKSGIIDPWFNLFIFVSIYAFYRYWQSGSLRWLLIAGVISGLGIMTKGPVALLVLGGTYAIVAILHRTWLFRTWLHPIYLILAVALAGGFWLAEEWISGRGYIVRQFFEYQIQLLSTEGAGHRGPFFYHFVVLLIGCFPLSVIGMKRIFQRRGNTKLQQVMLASFWFVLILFSLVQTKIVHYSSFCYFPLSFIAAAEIRKWTTGDSPAKWQRAVFIVLGAFLSLVFILVPLIGMNISSLDQIQINDPFAKANLQANAGWNFGDLLVGFLYLLAVIASIRMLRRNHFVPGMLFTIATALVILLFTPKIEKYSQGAVIEFYEERQGEDCYVETFGFKSYADLFYTRKASPSDELHHDFAWLMSEGNTKTTYIVAKINKRSKLESKYPKLNLLYERNGFVFYQK